MQDREVLDLLVWDSVASVCEWRLLGSPISRVVLASEAVRDLAWAKARLLELG